MRFQTQDPKYQIEVADGDAYLVNAATGVPLPKDEPVFLFRAKDAKAIGALCSYRDACENKQHIAAVDSRIRDFERFRDRKGSRMKEPDTAPETFIS
jgi:hypothetical protein